MDKHQFTVLIVINSSVTVVTHLCVNYTGGMFWIQNRCKCLHYLFIKSLLLSFA